jgi:hypothetical protein
VSSSARVRVNITQAYIGRRAEGATCAAGLEFGFLPRKHPRFESGEGYLRKLNAAISSVLRMSRLPSLIAGGGDHRHHRRHLRAGAPCVATPVL